MQLIQNINWSVGFINLVVSLITTDGNFLICKALNGPCHKTTLNAFFKKTPPTNQTKTHQKTTKIAPPTVFRYFNPKKLLTDLFSAQQSKKLTMWGFLFLFFSGYGNLGLFLGLLFFF